MNGVELVSGGIGYRVVLVVLEREYYFIGKVSVIVLVFLVFV